HPGQVLAAVDVRDGRPAVAGWSALEELTVPNVLLRWRGGMPAGVVGTRVNRGGTRRGAGLSLLSEVRSRTDVPVTYSGGIASLDDLRAVSAAGAAAAILGRSLLEGIIQLEDALSV